MVVVVLVPGMFSPLAVSEGLSGLGVEGWGSGFFLLGSGISCRVGVGVSSMMGVLGEGGIGDIWMFGGVGGAGKCLLGVCALAWQ